MRRNHVVFNIFTAQPLKDGSTDTIEHVRHNKFKYDYEHPPWLCTQMYETRANYLPAGS